jgi:hypothetical protein
MSDTELDDIDAKHQAPRRWVAAVNHWGRLGQWDFLPCRNPQQLSRELISLLTERAELPTAKAPRTTG